MTKSSFTAFLLAIVFFCIGAARAESVADFAYLEGIWTSQTEFQTDAGRWSPAIKTAATGQPILGGAMYELDTIIPFPDASFVNRMTFAYDRFNKIYRVVVFDDINGYMDNYYGQMSEDGSIVVDNLRSGTAFSSTEKATWPMVGSGSRQMMVPYELRPIYRPTPIATGGPICV